MTTWTEKLKHEFHELVPVTLFFFASFQVLALTESMMLKQYGISVSVFFGATLTALVISKVVVLTDHFKLVNRFPDKPLIYNVVWKTVTYIAAWLGIRYAEHLVHFWRDTGSFAEANHRLINEIVWPHFWCLQMWMLILLLVFCAFRELVRALGRDRILHMFFHEAVPSEMTK
jgi:hypothetical protein